MKMARVDCDDTIYADLEYADVTITDDIEDRRINSKRTSLCPDRVSGVTAVLSIFWTIFQLSKR